MEGNSLEFTEICEIKDTVLCLHKVTVINRIDSSPNKQMTAFNDSENMPWDREFTCSSSFRGNRSP